MKYSPFIILLVVSGRAFNYEAYPEAFSDFFIEREENIELLVAGENKGKMLKGMVTYDAFTLINNDENKAKLRQYLQAQNLTPLAIASIEKTLLLGIKDDLSCEGVLKNCLPKDIPGQAEFQFDFEAKQLKTYVSSDLLATKSTKHEYYSHLRGQSALINNSNLYTYVNKSDSAEFTWNNDAIIGLPVGHLSLDTQYRTDGNEFDIYEALYDVEVKNVRALLGYQEFNRTSLNSTDFLSYGADFSGTAITIGSSQNLLKGGIQSLQRVYFYAPEAGQLEIYQGERLLINRNIGAGQQFLSYNELPKGVYNITIIVRRGEQELVREQRQIVNNNQFSLPIDEFDYRLEAGYLDGDNLDETSFDNKHRYYWRAAASYRAAESLLLGTSVINNKDSLGWQLGGHWSPYNQFHLQYTGTVLDEGATYHYAQMNLYNFSASIRKVDSLDVENSLSTLIYDKEDLLEWNVGVSGSLLGGTGYLSYYNYKYDDNDNLNRDYQSLSTSWSREFFGGNISLSFTHNHYEAGRNDWASNIIWSKTFNDNLSARFGGFTDNDHNNSVQTAATLSTEGDRWRASTTAGLKVGDDTVADLSGSLNGHNDYLKYSAYGYANDEGQRSVSGSISSTQVISKSGVEATHQSGKAFVTLASKLEAEVDRDIKVNYQFVRNNKPWQRGSIAANNSQTLSITPYNEIGVSLDADNSNAEVNYDSNPKFIMPGMHYRVDTQVTPLESQIVIFNDANGDAVDFVQCASDGCKSVEMLSDDGVYRVNYVKGQTISLAAAGMACPYDATALGQEYITSLCSPNIQIAQQNESTLDNFAQQNENTLANFAQQNESTLDNFASALVDASNTATTNPSQSVIERFAKTQESLDAQEALLAFQNNSAGENESIQWKGEPQNLYTDEELRTILLRITEIQQRIKIKNDFFDTQDQGTLGNLSDELNVRSEKVMTNEALKKAMLRVAQIQESLRSAN